MFSMFPNVLDLKKVEKDIYAYTGFQFQYRVFHFAGKNGINRQVIRHPENYLCLIIITTAQTL